MDFKNDPVGIAIHDFHKHADSKAKITVSSDLCDDDIIPVPYLFRTYQQMPELERVALKHCKGDVLDIGAGAGCHSLYLIQNGFSVTAIDTSAGAISYLQKCNIPSFREDFRSHTGKYDSILMLMNGIGLVGRLENLEKDLRHLKKLLKPGGQILVDSSDIIYMYENEDGSMWMDLAAEYYGEMQFNLHYKSVSSGWFPWLYLDQEKFKEIASVVGFKFEILYEGDNNHYLAALKI